MFDWITLIVTCLGSLLVARFFTDRQKMWLIPFCTAYVFTLRATVGSIGGFLHFLFTAFNFVIIMPLCNGFRRDDARNNPVWKAFMIFWWYMFVIVFTGYYPIQGACKYLHEFVTTFAAGYFMASWVCKREGRHRRILIWVLVGAWFSVLYAIRHGGLDADLLDNAGRAGFDENLIAEGIVQNVNHVALAFSCFLPFLLVLLLRPLTKRGDGALRIAAGGAFVIVSLMIIRTGARNGAVAFLPCLWYFFNATKKRGRKVVQITLGVFVVLAMVGGVAYTMRNVDSLRAFDFSVGGVNRADALDAMSSGRIEMYKKNLALMTPIEMIIGKGVTTNKEQTYVDEKTGEVMGNRRVGSGNAHSMYMTIFYRTGFVGSALFIIFVFTAIRQGLRSGDRGRMALLFLGSWMATGVGEAWGMIGGASAILAGIAMGLLTNQPVRDSELMNNRDRRILLQRGWWGR